jgi:hypothetical protein
MKVEQIISEIREHFPDAAYSAEEALADLNSTRAAYLAAPNTPESALAWQWLERIGLHNRTERNYGVEYSARLPGEVLTRASQNRLIRYVGPTDQSQSFTKTVYPDIKYRKYSKRSDNRYSCYYLHGSGNLFVVFYNEPEVSVEAVFADPASAGNFNVEKDEYSMRDPDLVSVIIPRIIGQKKALGW